MWDLNVVTAAESGRLKLIIEHRLVDGLVIESLD